MDAATRRKRLGLSEDAKTGDVLDALLDRIEAIEKRLGPEPEHTCAVDDPHETVIHSGFVRSLLTADEEQRLWERGEPALIGQD